MALTLLNLRTAIQALLDDTSTTTQTEIDRQINIAGKNVVAAHDWPERWAEAFLTTVAPYTTGTADVTISDKTVSGTGTTWTAAMEGRRFALGYSSPQYVIDSRTSNTEMELVNDYVDTTATGQSYVIYQDRFSLASDCDQVVRLRIHKSGWTNPTVLPTKQLDEFAYLPVSTGTPTVWAFDGLDSSGYIKVRLWPVPDAVYRIHYRYLKGWTDLTQDAHEPILVEKRRDLILELALSYLYPLRHEHEKGLYHARNYERMLAKAKAEEGPVQSVRFQARRFDEKMDDHFWLGLSLPTSDAT